jgi:hypothetical protein
MDTDKGTEKTPPITLRQGGSRQTGTNTVLAGNVSGEDLSPQDNDQGLRWLDFLVQQSKVGDNLLKAMELIEEEQYSVQEIGDVQKGKTLGCEDGLQSEEAIAKWFVQADTELVPKENLDSRL